jgi:hypothetical protein
MKTDYAIIHKNWNGIEIEIRWNADYVRIRRWRINGAS